MEGLYYIDNSTQKQKRERTHTVAIKIIYSDFGMRLVQTFFIVLMMCKDIVVY